MTKENCQLDDGKGQRVSEILFSLRPQKRTYTPTHTLRQTHPKWTPRFNPFVVVVILNMDLNKKEGRERERKAFNLFFVWLVFFFLFVVFFMRI